MTEVREEAGEVVHVVPGTLEGRVHGVVDWDRRRDHMEQHHGQHLLSAAFLEAAGAQTVSFHLGREECTIDLDRPVAADLVERAVEAANRVVREALPVEVAVCPLEEARKLGLRRPPPPEPFIRVVTVPGVDRQACSGTHPACTGAVGMILVTGTERLKEGMRVRFVCGGRAVRRAHEDSRRLRAVGARLSASRDDLEGALVRLLEESEGLRRQLQTAEKRLAESLGDELASRGPVVAELFEGKGMDYLRMLAGRVVAKPGRVAILGGTGETASLVMARSPDVALDLRPLFREILSLFGGKGGGSPSFVQGGGLAGEVREALRLAREKVTAALGGKPGLPG